MSIVHTSRRLYPPVGLQVHSNVASVSVIPLYQQLVGAGRVLCIVEVLHSGIAGASHLECKAPLVSIMQRRQAQTQAQATPVKMHAPQKPSC